MNLTLTPAQISYLAAENGRRQHSEWSAQDSLITAQLRARREARRVAVAAKLDRLGRQVILDQFSRLGTAQLEAAVALVSGLLLLAGIVGI